MRDNGIGIDAELLPNVFELFEQGKRSLDRSQGGLGVGLTLVQRLVDLHQGSGRGDERRVRARAREFRVVLPCLAEVGDDAAPSAQRTSGPAPRRRAAASSSSTTTTTPPRRPRCCSSSAVTR